MLSNIQAKLDELKNPYDDIEETRKGERRSFLAMMTCGVGLVLCALSLLVVALVLTRGQVQETSNPTNLPKGGNLDNTGCTPAVGFERCYAENGQTWGGGLLSKGHYYDKTTCTCRECPTNFCCTKTNKVRQCPVGSTPWPYRKYPYECGPGIVAAYSRPYIDTRHLSLFTNKGLTYYNSLEPEWGFFYNKSFACPNSGFSHAFGGFGVIRGLHLNPNNKKFSFVLTSRNFLRVEKRSGAQIEGFSLGVVWWCAAWGESFRTSKPGSTGARDIKPSKPQVNTIANGLSCPSNAIPTEFAALTEIESLTNGGRLSVSLTARINDTSITHKFETKTGLIAAYTAHVQWCSYQDSLFTSGIIQTGLVNGGTVTANEQVLKTVSLQQPMACDEPGVALGLTKIDATGGLAFNMEVMSVSSTSFEVMFESLESTQIDEIEAAYLITCPMDLGQVTTTISNTCS